MSRRALAAWSVFAATAAVYWPLVHAGFVNWDDNFVLIDNPRLRALTWENLRWMATAFHMTTYQPVSWLLYALIHAFFGLSPRAYHAAGVLLHAGNAALLCLIIARLSKSQRWAWAGLGALLWAVHPLQVQAAAWVSALNDVLGAFLALCATLAFLPWKSERRARPLFRISWRYAAALALFILAGLARWKALCAPALWLIAGIGGLVELLPFFGAAGVLAAATAAAKGLSPAAAAGWAPPTEIAAKLLFYWRRLLWPNGFAPLYSPEFVWLHGAFQAAAPWLLLAVTAGLIRLRGPLKVWLAALIALAPTAFFATNGPALAADHYAYLAFMPLACAIGLWGMEAKRPRAPAALAIVVILIASLQPRLSAWQDSISLWNEALESDLKSPVARTALAEALVDADRGEEAAAVLREQLILFPEDPVARQLADRLLPREHRLHGPAAELYRLAKEDYEAGRHHDAQLRLEQAARLEPKAPEVQVALGLALYRQERYADALRRFQRAVALDPKDAEARNALGTVLVRMGNVKGAKEQFAEAVRLSPGSERYRDNLRKAEAMGPASK